MPQREAEDRSPSRAPEQTIVLTLTQAGVRFGDVTALHPCDAEIRRGDRVALIGPSGAGKSTFLRLLNGTVFPSSGHVLVDGHDWAGMSVTRRRATRRTVGTVYQSLDLVDTLKVVHNVNIGRLGQWPVWKAALSLLRPLECAAVAAALERVGVGGRMRERTGNLSGGQKQRVAVARVLVQRPRILLADEPIASLDPVLGGEIISLLDELSEEMGSTLVASLHDVEIALSRFPRIIGLRDGLVAFDEANSKVTPEMIEALYRREGPPS